jgi:hypothetical protein
MNLNVEESVVLVKDLLDDNGVVILLKGVNGVIKSEGFGVYDVLFGEQGIHMVTAEYLKKN